MASVTVQVTVSPTWTVSVDGVNVFWTMEIALPPLAAGPAEAGPEPPGAGLSAATTAAASRTRVAPRTIARARLARRGTNLDVIHRTSGRHRRGPAGPTGARRGRPAHRPRGSGR